MPHYGDGTEAKVGDLVRGKGYNVPHEIIGKVVNVRPGESCTLSVAFVGTATPVYWADGSGEAQVFRGCRVQADIEFGDTKGFVKIG